MHVSVTTSMMKLVSNYNAKYTTLKNYTHIVNVELSVKSHTLLSILICMVHVGGETTGAQSLNQPDVKIINVKIIVSHIFHCQLEQLLELQCEARPTCV